MKRTCLLVLGMHRSGTSALAETLIRLGARGPTNPLPSNKWNERGYGESAEVMRANEQILAGFSSSWRDWSRIVDLGAPSDQGGEIVDLIREVVRKEYGDAQLFVVKDPRICRLLPLWVRALKEERVEIKILISLRQPEDVANSLRKRDEMGLMWGRLLWLRHVLDAERESRGLPRSFLNYEDLLENWHKEIDRITRELGISWPIDEKTMQLNMENLIDSALRNHNLESLEDAPCSEQVARWIDRCYSNMQNFRHRVAEKDAMASLDTLNHEFSSATNGIEIAAREISSQLEERSQGIHQCNLKILQLQQARNKLNEEDVNYLRDLAIKLEPSNLHDARALMLLAQRVRPNGPLINKKLNEYADQLSKQAGAE